MDGQSEITLASLGIHGSFFDGGHCTGRSVMAVVEMCQIDACSAPQAGLLVDLETWSKFGEIGYYGEVIQFKLRVSFMLFRGGIRFSKNRISGF